MILAALGALVLSVQTTAISDIAFDTSLSATEADVAFGGGQTLSGGPDRVILIRFAGLPFDGNVNVSSATLSLRRTAGAEPVLSEIAIVNVPWGEGPLRTFNPVFAAPKDKNGKAIAPYNAATWRERFGQRAGWKKGGVFGSTDVTLLEGVTVSVTDLEFTISGLQTAAQMWANAPERNFGLALKFKNRVEFESANAATGGPRFTATYAKKPTVAGPNVVIRSVTEPVGTGPAEKLEIELENIGDAAAEANLEITNDDRTAADPSASVKLAPGEKNVVTVPKPAFSRRAAEAPKPIRIRAVVTGDTQPFDNGWTFYDNGQAVSGPSLDEVKSLCRSFNEVVLPRSRFSWIPSGPVTRLNPVSTGGMSFTGDIRKFIYDLVGFTPKPAPDSARLLSYPYSGLSGFGDTRYDGVVPGTLSLPYEPILNPNLAFTPLIPHRCLSSTEVRMLETRRGATVPPTAKTILLRLGDLIGRPVTRAEYSLLDEAGKEITKGLIPNGSVLLNAPEDPSPTGRRLLRVTKSGVVDEIWLENWQWLDNASRGNQNVCFLEARLNLPDLPIDATNLALDRAVSTSNGVAPAILAPLVRATNVAPVVLPAETNWIEIDLDRDRTIAEIAIRASGAEFWREFRVMGYGTGQRLDEASPLATEIDFEFASQTRARDGMVSYRGPAPRVRYIRIIRDSAPAPASLLQLIVRAAVLQGN
jgi:hypothetical protein